MQILSIETLSKEMCEKVFLENFHSVIDEVVNQFEDGTIVGLLEDFKRKNEVVVIFLHDKLQYFDPQRNQWIILSKIPTEVRNNMKSCAVQDRIYIIGDDDNLE